jgi:glycerol uptake facilitator-like aquaporin
MTDRPRLSRRALAEGLAAFALVFAGAGAVVADTAYDGALGTVGIALVFGLIVMAMVYATGHLSGAHINPAVTMAFTLTRVFPDPRRSGLHPCPARGSSGRGPGAARAVAPAAC